MGIRKTLASLVLASALTLGIGDGARASPVDIAYILEDSSQVSQKVVNSFDDLGLNYDVIRDSEIPSTDFSLYSALVITEDVDMKGYIPFTESNALFFDRKIADLLWDAAGSGLTTNRRISAYDGTSFVFDGVDIPVDDEIGVYNSALGKRIHYINPPIQDYVETIALRTGGLFRPVIAYSVGDFGHGAVKDLFFGLPESEEWNSNSELMFRNSLGYVVPEPATLGLLGSGALVALGTKRRRKDGN